MSDDITLLLGRHRQGDSTAFDELVRLLYPELRALAARRAQGSDLSATTLLHETIARYISGEAVGSQDRQEFFGLAATIMRRVIIDEVRQASAAKRQGIAVTLDESQFADQAPSAERLLAIDRALDALNRQDAQLRQVFECRYFAGYSTAETAAMLGHSARTTERMWREAKQWVAAELGRG